MVRTKKQVIDLLATKNKSHDSIKDTIDEYKQKVSEFYVPNVPTSPLPAMVMNEEKILHPYSFSLSLPSPALESSLCFEPPYVMNNFWPPLVSPGSKSISTDTGGKKLEAMFSNINPQEIQEMMKDCGYNEDEAILRLITQTDYLENIRHRIRINSKIISSRNNAKALPSVQQILKESSCRQEPNSHSTPSQYIIPKSLLLPSPPVNQIVQNIIPLPPLRCNDSKNTVMLKKEQPHQVIAQFIKPSAKETDNENMAEHQHKTHKKHHRLSTNITSGSRLTLDDALQQIKDSKTNEDMDGYAGWSAARLRAFKMIEKNPNSYYYRFNAPGEQQKKGKWTDEENALFLQRLNQVGANSQWGIFSIAIPGRVGYQCSNYYRFMIETGQLHDPNYVLDEKGKARYLFDKKTEDGAVEKIFRKHSKHGSISADDTAMNTVKKRKQMPSRQKDDSDDDDPTFNIKKKSCTKKKTSIAKDLTSKKLYPHILPANGSGRMTRQRLQQQEEQLSSVKSD